MPAEIPHMVVATAQAAARVEHDGRTYAVAWTATTLQAWCVGPALLPELDLPPLEVPMVRDAVVALLEHDGAGAPTPRAGDFDDWLGEARTGINAWGALLAPCVVCGVPLDALLVRAVLETVAHPAMPVGLVATSFAGVPSLTLLGPFGHALVAGVSEAPADAPRFPPGERPS